MARIDLLRRLMQDFFREYIQASPAKAARASFEAAATGFDADTETAIKQVEAALTLLREGKDAS